MRSEVHCILLISSVEESTVTAAPGWTANDSYGHACLARGDHALAFWNVALQTALGLVAVRAGFRLGHLV
jgi:hypothetical protein